LVTKGVDGSEPGADWESRVVRLYDKEEFRYMRTRKRAFILSSAAAFAVGLIAYAVIAAAEPVVPTCAYVNSTGNKSCARVAVAPSNAPAGFGNSQLGVRVRTLFAQPNNTAQGGKTSTVTLLFDNDFAINTAAGGGNCLSADIANKTIPDAYAACGPAGKNAYLSAANTLSGRSSTGPPGNYGGCTMVFHGPTANQVLLYARVTLVQNSVPNCSTPGAASAGNFTAVLTGTIAPAGVAGYGKKLTIPGISGLALPLDDFYATLKRGSFFQARCPAGTTPWKMRAKFAYSGTQPNAGGPADTVVATQPCT
jgi:hypothetical protein